MSCKGIFPTNASGQIEDDNKRDIFGKKFPSNTNVINIQANTAYHEEVKTSRPRACQDVAQVNVDETLSNCSTSSDSNRHICLALLPASEVSSDHGSDISLSVDDWFKPRTESVSSMDLDSVGLLKSDGIDTSYLGLVDGNNFLSTKDNVDMCIVTSICDIGLELDLPISTSCSKKCTSSSKFTCVDDKECNVSAILSDYHEQDSLMNDFTSSDILDKDGLLVGNTELIDTKCLRESAGHKCNLTTDITSSSCMITAKESEHYTCSRSSPTLDETSILVSCPREEETSQWTSSPIECEPSKDKPEWENLEQPNHSSHCVDLDEQDFCEFNYLAFQVDANEGIMNSLKVGLSLLAPQIDLNKSITDTKAPHPQVILDSVENNSSEKSKSLTPAQSTITETSNRDMQLFSSLKSSTQPNSTQLSMPSLKNTSVLSGASRSLLKKNYFGNPSSRPVTKSASLEAERLLQNAPIDVKLASPNNIAHLSNTRMFRPTGTSKDSFLTKRNENSSMAVIAISTDKSKSTTEIVINTSLGEQVYKGKTIDFIKGSNYVRVKQIGAFEKKATGSTSKVSTDRTSTPWAGKYEESSLTRSQEVTSSKEDLAATLMEPIDLMGIPSESLSDVEDIMEFSEMADTSVMEALAEIGITEDNLFRAKLANGKKFWICPVGECGKLYPRLCLLKTHILGHYGRRPYRCDFKGCHWSFYKYFKLKRHKETHEKRKDYECPKDGCGRSFTTVYNLKTHIKLHDRPAEMVCAVDECRARFQTKRDLEVHMKSHDREHAPYKCSYLMCGKHYYSANALNSHTRSHQHKEEELRCQYCGKLFDKPCRLKFHVRSHTGDKPYPCTFEGCGWAFTSSSKLNRHMFKHTNVRKFKCTISDCSKSFMRSEHLKEHILTHIQSRSFACPIAGCSAKFQAKSSLYVHLKKHRESCNPDQAKKVVMICPIEQCNRSYSCKSSLRQHMLKFHTPVLASDPSHLDYIALLTGGDDLGNLEGLQFATDIMTSNCTTSIMTNNPVHVTTAPTTVAVSTEGMDTTSHSLNNGNFNFQSVSSQHIFRTNSGVTHVLLAPPDEQANVDLLQAVPEPFESKPTGMPVVLPNPSISTVDDVKWIKTLSEPGKSAKFGSARTRYTLSDFLRDRAKKQAGSMAPTAQINTHQNGHQELSRCISDVVLGTGTISTQDITHSFLLQDDLPANHYLYHEDQMMVAASGVGELQVLLDSDDGTRQEFAESTINLRDLE